MISEILRSIAQIFTWLVVVAPWEQVIRVRLGSRVSLLQSGWYLRLPFVDRVYRQSTRRRLTVIPAQTLTTSDGKAVTIGSALGYEISDLRRLYETIHDAADTIESEASTVIADFIGLHDLAQCSPEAIEEAVRARLHLERYGLNSTEFYITNFAVVRTLRVITGEIKSWQRGESIDTSREDSQPVR